MVLTQINLDIGSTQSEVDCIAVALLSHDGQQHVAKLLAEISNRLGDVIWPMPLDALHITLCEIIQPKPYITDKSLLLQNMPHYQEVLADVLQMPPIKIVFNTIEVSDQAIIIKGTDDGTFNKIRSQLVSRLPLPTETKAPPNIVHSSLARYRKQVNVADVQASLADLTIDFTEMVNEFQLLSDTAPHLVNYTIAHRYRLL